MADDVLLNKAATIERCIQRAEQEYQAAADFATDFTHQDATILNLQRACEAALDMGNHLIRVRQLGIPQSSRDIFTLLQRAGLLEPELAETMKKMVSYRNIAVHDYQHLQLPITLNILLHHLDDFRRFSKQLLKSP